MIKYPLESEKQGGIGVNLNQLEYFCTAVECGSITKAAKNIWVGLDVFNLLGINNVNSYYWVTDISNTQYAVPNYLTGLQINGRITMQF